MVAVKARADPADHGELATLEALLAELPAVPVGVGDGAATVGADDDVDPAGLPPGQQAPAGKAAVGASTIGRTPGWQCPSTAARACASSRDCPVGRSSQSPSQATSSSGRSAPPGHRDAPHLGADHAAAGAATAGQAGGDHRPVDRQGQPAGLPSRAMAGPRSAVWTASGSMRGWRSTATAA